MSLQRSHRLQFHDTGALAVIQKDFMYIKNWDTFWDKCSLYRKDELCLIHNKSQAAGTEN